MSLTSPPANPAAPGAVPWRLDTSTFRARADAAWSWLFGTFWTFLTGFRTWYADTAKPELEALQTAVAGSATAAAGSATAAAASATAAAATVPLVGVATASNSAYVEFTGLVAGFDYVLEADEVYLSTSTDLLARVLVAGAPDTAARYDFQLIAAAGSGALAAANSGDTSLLLAQGFGATATRRGGFRLEIVNPQGVQNARQLRWHGAHPINGAAGVTLTLGAGLYRHTSAVNGVRIYPTSGTITAGTFTLRKIARA